MLCWLLLQLVLVGNYVTGSFSIVVTGSVLSYVNYSDWLAVECDGCD